MPNDTAIALVIALTIINVLILGLMVKLYTEIFKERVISGRK
jgi:hypothetical protein